MGVRGMSGMREQILREIRRLADENSGKPPGRQRFESATGIRAAIWYGVFWSRWGDALAEAGFEANKLAEKMPAATLFEKLAQACRHYGKFPTSGELRMYERRQPDFPSHTTFTNAFRSRNEMLVQLTAWVNENPAYNDVASTLPTAVPAKQSSIVATTSDGHVYLIQSGAFYKIGRSDQIERRVKQIRVALPDTATLIHTIKTDDPSGIEAYWHRRFQDRRANGEWFRLTPADVVAFRRRQYQWKQLLVVAPVQTG
jgi:hypothetical protein